MTPDINLLPVKERRRSPLHRLLPVAAALVLALAAMAGLSYWQSLRISRLDSEIDIVTQAKLPLLAVPREWNVLRQTGEQLEALPGEAELFLAGDRVRAYALPAVKCAGTGITLSGAGLTGTEILVYGTAASDARLYEYIRALEATELYTPILLVEVSPAGEGRRGFQLRFSLYAADGEVQP